MLKNVTLAMKTYFGHIIFLFQSFVLIDTNSDTSSIWTAWSTCSKSCDIGTQSRRRYHAESGQLDTQEQYCNLQYCPNDWKSCSGEVFDCYPRIRDGQGKCVEGKCHCMLGTGYNLYYCLPEVGNCIIREEPVTSLGYKDPELPSPYSYKLHSCTTNDNTNYEVHVVGIYGDDRRKNYDISVVPRGQITKPIVLVLTSYEPTNWHVKTNVALYRVFYGGITFHNASTSVRVTSNCAYTIQWKYAKSGHGSDTGGGGTLALLQMVKQEFGPITSFTGYYELSTYPKSHIILSVGGNPLQVLPNGFFYEQPSNDCSYYTPPTSMTTMTTTTTSMTTMTTTTTSMTTMTTTTTLNGKYLHYEVDIFLNTIEYRYTDDESFRNRNSVEYQEISNAMKTFWFNTLFYGIKENTVINIEKLISQLRIKQRISILSERVGHMILAAYQLVHGHLTVMLRHHTVSAIIIREIDDLHSVEMYSWLRSNDLCEYFNTLKNCDQGHICKEVSRIPACVYREPETEKSDGLSTAAAIGVSVCIVIILITVFIIFVNWKRRHRTFLRQEHLSRGEQPPTARRPSFEYRYGPPPLGTQPITENISRNTTETPSLNPPSYESLRLDDPPSYYEALKNSKSNGIYTTVI